MSDIYITEPLPISPTLANFLDVPYFTKLSEEEIVLSLWDYIKEKRLLIDNRTILLDKKISPVIHPEILCTPWNSNDIESSLVMIFIAKMHQDPDFIACDVESRLQKLREKQAARKILRFFKKQRLQRLSRPPSHNWLGFLARNYTHSTQYHQINGNGNGYNYGGNTYD